MKALGIDPGLRNVGLAILEMGGFEIRCVKAALVTSKLDKKKKAAENDQQTYNNIIETVQRTIEENKVDIVAIEQYSPFAARKSGAKIATVFGILYSLCKMLPVQIKIYRSLDLHRYYRTNGDKELLESVLCHAFPGLETALNALPKKMREHVADAAGHAGMALLETKQDTTHPE